MSVRLNPCSVVAASTYAGARRESYSFDVPEAVDVAVTTTGSGSRTDVIAFVITDPILEGKKIMEIGENGEPVPDSEGIDPREHNYWDAVRFSSVPSSARKTPQAFREWAQAKPEINGPVIPYAIVTQGSNSVGLEGKVKPFFETVMGRRSTIIAEAEVTKDYMETGRFTSYRTIGPTIYYETPWWATRARVKATIQGARSRYSPAQGKISGLTLGKSMRQYRWNDSGTGSTFTRENYVVWADLAIPASRRGTTESFRLRATIESSGALFGLNRESHMFLEVEFLEDPNAVDNSDPETD